MNRYFLDVHALQTVPPSNLNRDDTGAPKSAVYGGVRRARVSSQAWKRAIRTYFGEEHLLDPDELGVRTKKVAEILAARISERRPSLQDAAVLELAAAVIEGATGSKVEAPRRNAKEESGEEAAPRSKYLMFLSARQLDGLADLAVEGADDIRAYFQNKKNKARAKEIADTLHSVDIALFGRMVADSADINVDAAVQVAHAISVHRVENESDYYTAVDDENTAAEPGAGMIGSVEFNSATLYRYAAVGIHQLADNLGQGLQEDEPLSTPVRRAVEAFVQSFVESLPTGKINTFGNHTLPDAVIVKLRTTRPMSYAAAFEEPVTGDHHGGHVREAAERLSVYVPDIERTYGDEDTTRTWVLSVGPNTAALAPLGEKADKLSALVASVGQAVADRMDGAPTLS
ncbi:type I-E CRISPR-associated protein Cas7/Cse4/CasC [Streptomyces sp. CA-294286]|uniref:type I-E CRISPR-associated protein Cas7/Cse4/CasC n=1 Tax=Streptomyces sp. CA-294286 TaxID=3240070 RepID=UPI003D89C461